MDKPLVLIVEDDADIRMLFSEILNDEGYETVQAENGRAALDLLLPRLAEPARLPRCIVLDLMMPVMDGAAFLQHVKDEPSGRLARIPVLVTTARGNISGDAKLPLPVTLLKKPTDLDVLLAAVARACSGG